MSQILIQIEMDWIEYSFLPQDSLSPSQHLLIIRKMSTDPSFSLTDLQPSRKNDKTASSFCLRHTLTKHIIKVSEILVAKGTLRLHLGCLAFAEEVCCLSKLITVWMKLYKRKQSFYRHFYPETQCFIGCRRAVHTDTSKDSIISWKLCSESSCCLRIQDSCNYVS